MKAKQTPIERPARKPYLRCNLGDHGVFVFRLPSPGRAQALMQAYTEIDRSKMSEVEGAAGDLIMECWADGAFDLEGGTGAEVFAELWDAGWSFDLLIGLVAALVDQMNDAFIAESDVSVRVDFFGKTPGRSTSDTSGTPTSTTPGDSTD